MENKKKFVDFINDEQVRNNAESVVVAIAAIAFVIITKGFINGFSWGLFLTLEPYASGIGVGVASAIIQNNMINRGMPDEIADNKELQLVLKDVGLLDVQITDYEYAEDFLDGYNKSEFDRLQKKATDKEVRTLKYLISMKRSAGGKFDKLQKKLDYITEYGSKVKGYKQVTLQDLLSFQASNELSGKDRINFDPVASQRKGMIKSRLMMFIASGIMAGLPLVAGENGKELFIFLCVWIPLLGLTALRTYIKTRKITASTYFKSLQFKKNVLILCIENYKHWTPPTTEPIINKDKVVEEVELIEYSMTEDNKIEDVPFSDIEKTSN